MVRHYYDRMQDAFSIVRVDASFYREISGKPGKTPALMCCESDEEGPVVLLDVWEETSPIVVPEEHG
jgi:hypothetical protein